MKVLFDHLLESKLNASGVKMSDREEGALIFRF